MLRCLTIRRLVARHTDDGDARYSSVRQLFHASSEHGALGQTPSTQAPSWVGPHHSGRSRASRRKDSIINSSHPPRHHGALKSMHQSWFGAVTSEYGCEYGVVLRRLRTGFVRPERRRISPMVLAAGHATFGFMRSRRAFSFRAPHDGNRYQHSLRGACNST